MTSLSFGSSGPRHAYTSALRLELDTRSTSAPSLRSLRTVFTLPKQAAIMSSVLPCLSKLSMGRKLLTRAGNVERKWSHASTAGKMRSSFSSPTNLGSAMDCKVRVIQSSCAPVLFVRRS